MVGVTKQLDIDGYHREVGKFKVKLLLLGFFYLVPWMWKCAPALLGPWKPGQVLGFPVDTTRPCILHPPIDSPSCLVFESLQAIQRNQPNSRLCHRLCKQAPHPERTPNAARSCIICHVVLWSWELGFLC